MPTPAELARKLLTLAKEATNGWACYSKREIERDEIARLHRRIADIESELEAALSASAPQPEIEHFWTALSRGWDIEPREYFEREAVKMGFKSPIEMAVHWMWKRHAKDWPNEELKAKLEAPALAHTPTDRREKALELANLVADISRGTGGITDDEHVPATCDICNQIADLILNFAAVPAPADPSRRENHECIQRPR